MPGCEAAGAELVVRGRDRLLGHPGTFSVVRCTRCGLLRTTPRPTREAIGAFYEGNYGPHAGDGAQAGDGSHASPTAAAPAATPTAASPASRPKWKDALDRLIEFNTERLPAPPRGTSKPRVLEVGCATGSFLETLRARGFYAEGIEPSEAAAQRARARGFTVHVGQLETVLPTPPSEPFDMVVGWMVLEHLHDPIGVLRALRRWVRPDAYFVGSVPCASGLFRRLFGSAWFPWELPRHLHHFDERTLGALLEAAGWRLERVEPHRVASRLIASAGYVLEDAGIAAGRKLVELSDAPGNMNLYLYPLASLLAAIGETGCMTFWARPAP